MKLARIVIPGLEFESSIQRLLNQSEVELLQLDAARLADSTQSFNSLHLWRIIHRSLYLRPELRVVTDAAASDVVGFMDWLGQFLIEHDSGEMLITAVRGSNVSAHFDELLPTTPELRDRSILSAQIEIGASPLVMALEEGGQIVVAGAYDIAAPFIAAASEGLVGGYENQLASLSAASQFEGVCVDTDSGVGIVLEQSASEQVDRVRNLNVVKHADLNCDYSRIVLEPVRGNRHRIGNVIARRGDGTWKARITVDRGFQASVLVETHTGDVTRVREFCLKQSPDNVEISEYVPTDSHASSQQRLMWVKASGQLAARCQDYVNALQLWLTRELGREANCLSHWVTPITEVFETRIPSDRVVLSVDTRPAREWI